MNGQLHNVYLQLLSYARSLWRRRWYGLAVAWVVCVAGWLIVARMPDSYTSSARIYIDTQSMLRPLLKGLAVEGNIFEQISIMQRTLLSRPNLQKVARMTDLDLTAKGTGAMEALIESLRRKIKISISGNNLFTISFQNPDPQVAKNVVQALLTIFVESNLGASRKDLNAAQKFLDEQISQYEGQLVAAEHRLANFKKANIGFLPGEGSYYTRLQAARAALGQNKAALSEALSRRAETQKQIADIPQFVDLAASDEYGPPSDTSLRILELQKKLDNLLLQYTDKHPDVIAVKRTIKRLQGELQSEQQMAPTGPDESAAAPVQGRALNPLYQQIKLSLVDLEGKIATLRNRVAQSRAAIVKLEGNAQTVPEVEAKLADLNRDYGIIKKNYERLLSRRESAKIANDVETRGNKIDFRIVDPPDAPVKPSGPNRFLFLSVVLVAGLGAGGVFAFVMGQIDGSFSSVSEIKRTLTYTVLGSISAIISAVERRRRVIELCCFALVIIGLLGAYAGLMAIEVFAKPQLT